MIAHVCVRKSFLEKKASRTEGYSGWGYIRGRKTDGARSNGRKLPESEIDEILLRVRRRVRDWQIKRECWKSIACRNAIASPKVKVVPTGDGFKERINAIYPVQPSRYAGFDGEGVGNCILWVHCQCLFEEIRWRSTYFVLGACNRQVHRIWVISPRAILDNTASRRWPFYGAEPLEPVDEVLLGYLSSRTKASPCQHDIKAHLHESGINPVS